MISTMRQKGPSLIILFEHPEWQKPLFATLERRGVSFEAFDLKEAVFSDQDLPLARLYFNQASPSAYVRGNTRAVPLALAYLEDLEQRGLRVVNGVRAFRLELSKMAQVGLMRRLGVPHPRTWVFNSVEALQRVSVQLPFPGILKPNQGGSGARMFRVDSFNEVRELLASQPEIWLPDNLLLFQEYLPHDSERQGIVRLEFLGGKLLYAMRVVSGGSFNLCPSEVCNPQETEPSSDTCAADSRAGATQETRRPEFHPYPEVPEEAIEMGQSIIRAAGIDVGAVEYLETADGRRVFYDVNANSNLRKPIGESFGFDPFERVVDYLLGRL